MSDEVRKVTIQIRAPKGKFPGEVAEGWYVVFENNVILTDQDGKPIPGAAKRSVGPGDDAHLIACRMVREGRGGRASSDFNRRLIYPKLVY
jgi:hypothetical protein